MKLKFSLLALATALLITTTTFAQEQIPDWTKPCADWQAQTLPEVVAKSHCLGVVAQRVNSESARATLSLLGEAHADLSIQVTPLKLAQTADGQQSQTVAGRTTTTNRVRWRNVRSDGQFRQGIKMIFHADAEVNAVAIKWRFAGGLDAEGKRTEHDITVIVKLEDEPTSNVTTITPAR